MDLLLSSARARADYLATFAENGMELTGLNCNGNPLKNGVRVAIEMHPHNLVFSPVTLRRLVELIGATNLGAEMDPSHLMWQGMDVVASIRYLGPLVFHAAAAAAV